MSAEEFLLWMAEYRRNPWGELRDEINLGGIRAEIFNMAGKISTMDRTLTWRDFSFHQSQELEEEDPEAFFKKVKGNGR